METDWRGCARQDGGGGGGGGLENLLLREWHRAVSISPKQIALFGLLKWQENNPPWLTVARTFYPL